VFFFDTPELTLDRAGVVVRARRIQGKGGDSVVKLRPVVPDQLPASLRSLPNLVVEVDAMPGGPQAVLQAAARLLRRARPEGVGLDDLVQLRVSC
jgi:hypothetical protein